MSRSYAAFISYRHAALDSAAAEQVHRLIERYRIPEKLRKGGKKRFGYVFRDKEELPVSSDLSADICAALDASGHLIVICTPETKKSPWVEREIAYFLKHHHRRQVFAVLAAGEPAEVFPQILTEVDGIPNSAEPLALDIRAASGREMCRRLRREILRLYAALLGCPYDALALRHQKRRFRVAAAVAATVLAVVGAFSGTLLVKNRQLAEQKAQVQLRESELLVQNARDALAAGDYAAAALQAAAALPHAEDPRPYVAEAEQVLIGAMGIFDDGRKPWIQTKTTLALTAPAADLHISEDGSCIAVIDRYGAVSCHDAGTGRLRWQTRLDAGEDAALLAGPGESLIAFSGRQLAALDLKTGEQLWCCENGFRAAHQMSADKTKIALLEQTLTADGAAYAFHLLILSAESGQLLCRTEITEGALLEPSDELPYVWVQETPGAFSPDGSLFYGCYGVQTADGAEAFRCYAADTESGQLRQLCSIPGDPVMAPVTQLFAAEDALYLLHRNDHSNVAATAEKIDCATGQLLWAAETPAQAQGLTGRSLCAVQTASNLYIARGDSVYTVSTQTGAAALSGTLGGDIYSISIVDGRWFAFLTADGEYTLGWKNENGIFHSGDGFYDASLQLGSIKKAALWGGGALRAVLEDDRISAVTAAEDGGWAVTVPADGENTLVIHRIRCPADISLEAPAEMPADWESRAVPAGENTGDLQLADTWVPAEAVRQRMELFGGKYLLVKTDAETVYIAHRESGSILLENRALATPTGRLWAFEDAENARLYLADDFSRTGLCIDTTSWTVLAEIPGFLCYDPANDRIYRLTDSGETVSCTLPDTETLVNFAQTAFAAP